MAFMDDALNRIYAAFNPNKPASPQYYVDCGDARGETDLAENFLRHLNRASATEGQYLRFLFSGHVGCGKSSELQHLSFMLKNPVQPFQPRYLPILIDANDYVDLFDVTLTDILLAAVTETAATLRQEIGYELKDSYFKTRFAEIKEFILSDIEINKAEVEVLGAKVEFQRLKSNPDARKKVRERLAPHAERLATEINRVFEEARAAVKRKTDALGRPRYEDIILIFDNLEKIAKFEKVEGDLEANRELFIERYAQLTNLQVHTAFTISLRLARSTSDGPRLAQFYGQEPFVLPMVKIFERGTRAPYQKGLDRIYRLLTKRLGNLTLEQAIAPDALEYLIKYTGGHSRYLVNFVQNACTYTDELPISLSAMRKAIKQTATTFSTSIPEFPENHWDRLARLELSPNQKIVKGDEEYLKMLENLSIFEYMNGGDGNEFDEAAPWYAVNPIVRELRNFKEAIARLKSQPLQPVPPQSNPEPTR